MMKCRQKREGDWKCVVCHNLNFAFREECNRCGLISREQNDHQTNMIAYSGQPSFLTPIRKKATDHQERSPNGLLSVSPVLRQLGL